MVQKSKNGAGPRHKNTLLILTVGVIALIVGGIIGILFALLTMSIDPPAPPLPMSLGDETLTIPLASAIPVYTTDQYTGVITLLVMGFGQVNERRYSDAFYLYLNAQQEPLAPPIMQPEFMLEIDGESAATLLDLNNDVLPYSSTHTYLIRYAVGSEPRRIAFRTMDRSTKDNTGQLQIVVLSDISELNPATPVSTSQSIESTEEGELVIVPFTSGSPVYTETLYSGLVTLLIRGTGQAGGTDYSDAFYLYEHPDHSSYVPPVLGDFAMELDGQIIHKALNFAPEYASDHVYRVTYDVGPEPRRIGFRNTDLTTGDNQGTYYVEVIPGA